nr:hypothetical protein [Tanacetum cinerariifolium]
MSLSHHRPTTPITTKHKVEEVQFHLLRNEIDISNTKWNKHGEKDEPSISTPKPVNATTEFVDDMDFASDIPTDGQAIVEMINTTKDNFYEDDLVKISRWKVDNKPHKVYENIPAKHVEKNVAESLVRTLLNVSGKKKDRVNARLDLAELGVKLELFSMQEEDKTTLPPAGYTLTNAEKDVFCKMLYNIRVPRGYCLNFSSLVSLKDRKLSGLKSHDYHMLMQEFLPIAICSIMHPAIRYDIIRFCFFFKSICSKEITLQELDQMQVELVVTLFLLEKFFPLSFFDIMVERELAISKESVSKTTRWIKKLSIVFKTPPKNYKDTYNEVDEEFSTVIHQHNDNILPRVDRRDLGNESRNDYYGTDCGDKEDTIVHTGQDRIHECHSPKSKAKYVPVLQKHNPNVKSPIAITGCVLGLPNVDTWDDILKKFGMRTPGRYSSNDSKCVSSKETSITSIPKEGPLISRLSKEPIPKELLAWYGYDIVKDHLPVAKKPIPKVIFKSPILIKGCVLGLANVEIWDNIVKKIVMRTLGRCLDKSKGKERFDVEGDERISSLCLISSSTQLKTVYR